MADSGDDLDYMLPGNCPSPYFDSWDRHNSIAFSATKGLRNAPGENNCFVNCAVQVFWHLDVFRRSYRRLLGHTCMGNSCIFCALKVIFTQFQYSDKSSLHPDALRKALAETFANQQRFQLGHMDDAAECFENILRRIHYHIACSHNEDACTAPHCLPHQKFSMVVYEKVVCPCGASSSPLKFSEMVHYVSASALVSQSRMMQENGDALHPDRFGLLLRKAGSMGDVRDCPANCGKQVQKLRTLLNIPDVVSVGLVWDSDHPSMETTTEVAGALGTAILLQDMYHRVMPDVRKLPRLQLVAVVCYYGKHYSTFVFHSKMQTWIYFDDATVREIGPQWENVVERCSRGRFQPLLLLYANPSAAPVSVDTAPRKRVMAPGYAPVGVGEDSEGGMDRTQDMKVATSMAARSTTPTPKLSPQNVAQGSYPPFCPAPETQDSNGRDSPARLSREHSRQPSFLFAVTGKNDKNRPEGGEEGDHHPGVPNPNVRRQLLDGGAAAVHMESVTEDAGNYADYTLSSGDQYRRPSLNGADTKSQLPMPPNVSRYPETQHRDSFTKRGVPGKEKAGVDVVRYQMDGGRGGGHATEFSYPPPMPHGEGFPPQKGEKMGFKPPAPHGRQRSLSSGREDEGGDGGGGGSQHMVVKPKPTGHGNYEAADAFPHSALQSGLSTLPRHKAPPPPPPHHGNDPAAHQRSTSTHQEVAQLTRKGRHQCTAVNPPLPPGTPPPEYSSSTKQDGEGPSHSRQTSGTMKASASMGHIDQVVSSKKPPLDEKEKVKKKVKKEKKSEKDSSSKKAEKDTSSKKSGDKKKGKSDSNLKKSESEGDLLAGGGGGGGGEKSGGGGGGGVGYIDRRMVESILKHQGVHRQNSSCSNNSGSSVDSDSLMGRLLLACKGSGLTADVPFDSVSLGSQKDSGYGSSDRNSSSSNGSGTVDPYTQYFISKSMVVPRSVNMGSLMEQQQQGQYSSKNGEAYSSQPYPQSGGAGGREDGRLIMHPIKESSKEDVLWLPPSEPLGTQKFIVASAAPVASQQARPPPVPPKNFAQFQIIKSSNSSSAHERESSLDSLDKDENISDLFVTLCKKADAQMDSCMLSETSDEITSALYCCDQALGCLKEAMAQKELTSKALTYVQKKHNSCLLKLRMLQKRALASRQEPPHPPGVGADVASSGGNRSSITSSDSDMSDQLNRQPRPDSRGSSHQHPRRPHPAHDSAQGSYSSMYDRQNSIPRQGGDSVHNRQNSIPRQGGDSMHDRQNSIPRQPADSVHERQHSASSRQGRESGRQGQMAEGRGQRDGSVPRTQQRVSLAPLDSGGTNHHRTSSSGSVSGMPHSHSANFLQGGYASGGEGGKGGDAYGSLPRSKSRRTTIEGPASVEAFQSFPNAPAAAPPPKFRQPDVSCSQQSLDSLRSDSGSEHGSTGSGHKMGRQTVQGSLVQRQQRQACSAMQQQYPQLQQQQSVSVPFSHPQDPGRKCGGQMSQRPVLNSGQSGQHFVSGHPSWQQQQQQQYSQQQYSHPQAAHLHPSGSSYPRPSPEGLQPPPPPSALQGAALSLHPSHTTPTPGPGPKPSSLLYPPPPPPPAASGGKPRMAGSQGQSLPPRHDATESSSERLHSTEGSAGSQKPVTMEDSDSEGATVSVRALLSRFENTSLGRPGKGGSRPCSRHGSMKSDNGSVGVRRTRSKSESFSRKPKSVLKNKKNKNRPRKSVTFADSMALYANCDDPNSGYESARELSTPRVAMDDRAYYSDDEEQRSVHVSYSDNELEDVEDTGSSNSDESPLGEDGACQLCHKRRNEPGKLFCAKCSFYMGKLSSS